MTRLRNRGVPDIVSFHNGDLSYCSRGGQVTDDKPVIFILTPCITHRLAFPQLMVQIYYIWMFLDLHHKTSIIQVIGTHDTNDNNNNNITHKHQ